MLFILEEPGWSPDLYPHQSPVNKGLNQAGPASDSSQSLFPLILQVQVHPHIQQVIGAISVTWKNLLLNIYLSNTSLDVSFYLITWF